MGYQNINFKCRNCFKEFNKEIHYSSPNGDYIDVDTEEIECPFCGKIYKVIDAYLEVEILEKDVYEGNKGGIY